MEKKYLGWKLASLFFILLIISLLTVMVYGHNKQTTEEHCMIKGGPEHLFRTYSDYPLAVVITNAGYELGPYFHYDFCED